MTEPIMAFVGNWEPLAFRRRRGVWPHARIEQHYEEEHSPEMIKRLRDVGVTFVITHFFKGFGLQAEADEIAKTARFIEQAHQAGIGVGAYISSNIFYETFLHEQPDAENWVGINYDGSKTTYFKQYFRWQFCYSNPAYVAYIRKVIDKAIEIGADLLHLDNFNWMPDHDYCHCEHCVEGFRRFLTDKLSAQQRKEMLGFEAVEHVFPPPGISEIRLQREVVPDPLMRLWIAYRTESLTGAWRALCEHARSRRDDIKMEFNGEALACIYNHTKMGVDFDRLLPDAWAFWGEDSFPPEIHPNGCIGGRWRSMKMAEAYGSHFFGYAFKSLGDDEAGRKGNRLLFAEHLAYNHNCVADVGDFHGRAGVPCFEDRAAELALLRKYEKWFADTTSAARVAVFRNGPSQAYCSITTQVIPYSVEQMLFLRSIPFDILMDSHLDRLGRYDVVIAPGTLCLTAAQREALLRFASDGGTLILIGQVGKYDEWGRRSEQSLPVQCGLDIGAAEAAVSGEHGQGRVHFRPPRLPEVVTEEIARRTFPEYREVWFYYPSRLWDEPADADDLAACVNEAIGGPVITHDGPRTLICQPRRKNRTLLMHVLQYEAGETIEAVTLKLRDLTTGVRSVRRIDFDDPSPRPVEFTENGGDVTVRLEALDVYAVLIIE